MPFKESVSRYSPKTKMARQIFNEIKKLPERDGIDGVSQEYFLRKIMEYLDYLDTTGKPPTLAGLSLFCGVSRDVMSIKSRQEEFAPSLGKFRQIIEMTLEENWIEGEGGATSIFYGKNMGYNDKQVIEVEHKLSSMSQEEIDSRIKRLEMIDNEQNAPRLDCVARETCNSGMGIEDNSEVEAIYEIIEDGED